MPSGTRLNDRFKSGFSVFLPLQLLMVSFVLLSGCTRSHNSAPPSPASGFISAKHVSAGRSHTCAVTSSGGVKCWGYNQSGELGNGTKTDSAFPVDVINLPEGVLALSAHGYHTCAVTSSGGVKCWGRNDFGQLGTGATGGNSSTPVDVSNMPGGVTSISAGLFHSCALTASGAVQCWGRNDFGQLGTGATGENSSTPVDVTGLTAGVVAISAGDNHTCALTSSGGVKCWGRNDSGQLGTGAAGQNSSTSADVTGLTFGVSAISAGDNHTCALTLSKEVKCWGGNWAGQLGNRTSGGNASMPVEVTGFVSGAVSVSSGGAHTCALTSSGAVKCWGDNFHGQLGNGSQTGSSTPVDVSGLSAGITAVSTGEAHACAITSTGVVKCWGDNNWGQLGNGTMGGSSTPSDVSGMTTGLKAVSAGDNHTCALTSSGGVKCWGYNDLGQLGNGTRINSLTPLEVQALPSGVTAISAGDNHTCAVTDSGAAKCWGDNIYRQLGDGSKSGGSLTPVDVSGLNAGVKTITSGDYHTCAITSSGAVKCWGGNWAGQLGNGGTSDSSTPVDVLGIMSDIVTVGGGDIHTCALASSGAVQCWGDNVSGQLGNGTTSGPQTCSFGACSKTPITVSGIAGAAWLAVGGSHSCAVTSSGGVKCWGGNLAGQLGNGTTNNSSTPVDVSGLTSVVVSISAGDNHTCALTASGGVKCWGDNDFGQLGSGIKGDSSIPVDVTSLTSGVVSVSARDNHTCALTASGGAKCWGDNLFGQLGNGSIGSSSLPVAVVGFSP